MSTAAIVIPTDLVQGIKTVWPAIRPYLLDLAVTNEEVIAACLDGDRLDPRQGYLVDGGRARSLYRSLVEIHGYRAVRAALTSHPQLQFRSKS
jgi:hypothetical protein